jgi:hypothetical protein
MAVKIKGLNALTQKLKLALNVRDDALLTEVGRKVVELIQGFTRSGKSIVGSNSEQLKPLSQKYIEQRKKRVREGRKHIDPDFFSPAKSNLTLTGQMLRSIDFTKNKLKASVTVGPTGKRDDGLTNKKVAQFVSEGGRPFIGIHDKGLAQVNSIVKRYLRRKLQSR